MRGVFALIDKEGFRVLRKGKRLNEMNRTTKRVAGASATLGSLIGGILVFFLYRTSMAGIILGVSVGLTVAYVGLTVCYITGQNTKLRIPQLSRKVIIVGGLLAFQGAILLFFLYRTLITGTILGAYAGLAVGYIIEQNTELRIPQLSRKVIVVAGLLVFAGLMAFGLHRQEHGEVKLNATLL